jgi:hypothetical protein
VKRREFHYGLPLFRALLSPDGAPFAGGAAGDYINGWNNTVNIHHAYAKE